MDDEVVESLVHGLNEKISAQIDCTACANCCQSFMITVTPEEVVSVAQSLDIGEEAFKSAHIEEGGNGMLLMNTIPCNFLQEKRCSIYVHRFDGCRQFPYLEQPEVKKRLPFVFQYYGLCPIIFNVLETIKKRLHETD